MNTMDPIMDYDLINDIADFLSINGKTDMIRNRNYVMFMFGIYTGLRITRMLDLRVRDIRQNYKIINYLYLREYKRRKERKLVINDELKEILNDYVKDMNDFEYLFQSQKGNNKPLSRQGAYEVLKKAADVFELECIGCHTLRKTFGWMIYDETRDPAQTMLALNQSDVDTAMLYIGVKQDRVNQIVKGMSIRRKRK